jgi:putative ATPase
MSYVPLAERLRPRTLDDVVGHGRWLDPGSPLRRAVASKRPFPLIFWGPPGCGKTTLARIIAADVGLPLATLSATSDGVKELRSLLDDNARRATLDPRPLLLFIDEIHRWNKSQQDALLPQVESGAVIVIGATTENPSFQVNAALRSRVRVVRLEPLTDADVVAVLRRALSHPDGLPGAAVDDDALAALAQGAAGDARRALQDLERVVLAAPGERVTREVAGRVLVRADLRHDRTGDDHHDVLSALIKSMRGSDPDAAVYWLARLLAGGEDPEAVARRLVIFASEDVGNADPRALSVATAAAHAAATVGMPEVRIPLAQAVLWLACSPKSDASYRAINAAMADVERLGALPVPLHLRSRPGPAAWNDGPVPPYRNPHEHPLHIVAQRYRPEALDGRIYYEPVDYGDEKTLRARLQWWKERL